jgi:LPXTG-site transpeptidase (sortase) family protein
VVRPKRKWPLVLITLGIVMFLVGAYDTLLQPAHSSQQLRVQAVYPEPIISPEAIPSFSPPPSGPPIARDGLHIKIPELKIDLPIVEGDGVNAPLNKAAHDPRTVWPGQGGRSMLYAHARPGMFGNLSQIKVGQHVDIYRNDSVMLRYVVSEAYPRWPSTDLKWLQPVNHEELVLLTCTTYSPNDPRVIVVAKPVRG